LPVREDIYEGSLLEGGDRQQNFSIASWADVLEPYKKGTLTISFYSRTMKIQLWVVGLLAIASAGCSIGMITNATPSDSTAPLATAALTSTDPANLSLQEKLKGTWSSGFITVTFNWDAGTYSGVMLDQPFSKTLEFVSETDSEIVFETNGSRMVGRFEADGEIRVTEIDSSTSLLFKRT
jgi:hypothetical protein